MRIQWSIYSQLQPTLPLRGATPLRRPPVGGAEASTHAPLAGSDPLRLFPPNSRASFNPRSPCGERHPKRGHSSALWCASTHAPLAGSDIITPAQGFTFYASTHAPLAGSDDVLHVFVAMCSQLQPTLPLRGATRRHGIGHVVLELQPTLPLRGATTCWRSSAPTASCFNPRSPCGERRRRPWPAA